MRVREIMSSPVICVPPDMPLKEVAKVLVARGISAAPVVDRGKLVGILSEADLIPLELAPDLEALLAAELGEPSPYRVTVRDGVVDLIGPSDPVDRRLATLLARGVPGVREVRLDEEG